MRALRSVSALAAALLAIASLPLGAADKLYKWTDADGVTHYSDAPPADSQQFETRAIDVPAAPEAPAEEPAADSGEQPAAPALPREEACAKLTENRELLGQPVSVHMDLDGDGTQEVLSAEQRAEQLAIIEERLAAHCQPRAEAPAGEAEGEGEPSEDGSY